MYSFKLFICTYINNMKSILSTDKTKSLFNSGHNQEGRFCHRQCLFIPDAVQCTKFDVNEQAFRQHSIYGFFMYYFKDEFECLIVVSMSLQKKFLAFECFGIYTMIKESLKWLPKRKAMDRLHYRLIFGLVKKNQIAGKNLLKVLKFQNLVEKCQL